jgi:peptidoglycan/LPS O-acetylase OafA/YrhL
MSNHENHRSPADSPTGATRLPEGTSRTIDALRFPLMVGVIAIHAASAAVPMAGDGNAQVAHWIQWILSNALALVAVPMFFAMSALLLATGQDGSWALARAKMTTRVVSLGRPFVLWCCMGAAILMITESVPALAAKMRAGGTPLTGSSWFDVVDRTFGLTGGTPIAYQFWFIRDLLILILIHPLLLRIPSPALWILWTACVLWWFIWPDAMVAVHAPAAASFIGGLLLARHAPWLEQLPKTRYLHVALGIVATVAMVCMALDAPRAWSVLFILSACPLVWSVFHAVRSNRLLAWLGGFSFFMYCSHEPLLTVIRKLMLSARPSAGPWDILLIYLGSGALTIVLCVSMAYILSRWIPTLYAFVTGGRSRPIDPPPRIAKTGL